MLIPLQILHEPNSTQLDSMIRFLQNPQFGDLAMGRVIGTCILQSTASNVGINLTDPLFQATASFNNYCQSSTQNMNSGVNASADHICYPNNISTDLTGFIDMGITSSGYGQAAYSVTGPNEGYLFGSAPAASGTSGDMVFATDASGTNNGMRWYVNGYNKAIGAYSMKLAGTGVMSGTLQVCEGFAMPGYSKVVSNIGAATTYTVPAKCSYAYITTSAASLAITFPAAVAALDGLQIEFVSAQTIASVTWASAGGTFVNAPAAFAVANVPVKFIYHHATTQWLPA